MIDIQKIETFLCAAEKLNVSEAAKQLHLDPAHSQSPDQVIGAGTGRDPIHPEQHRPAIDRGRPTSGALGTSATS